MVKLRSNYQVYKLWNYVEKHKSQSSLTIRTIKMMAGKLVVLCCVLVAVYANEKYTDKYDNINIQEILENKRLLLAYSNCLLDKGKCSPEGKELKDHIQDALETGCSKCTEAQEKGSYTIIEHLIHKEQDIWNELCAKYDPEGKYKKKYEERAKAKGLAL